MSARRLAGGYGIFVGLMMLALWTMLLSTGQVPELETEPVNTTFHLVNEGTTALLLIMAGVGLLRDRSWGQPLFLFATGMVVYATITAAGYYGEAAKWAMSAMLLIVTLLGVICALLLVRPQPGTGPRQQRRRVG
ncbi:MAG: hypothetical protein ACOY94_20810 [Bacillota bacterium]